MKTERKMEQRINIDYIAHEAIVARMERIINKLWIALLIMIFLFMASNAMWIWRDSQYENVVTTETVTQDSGDGGSNTFTGDFIGGDYYGETDSNTDN